MNTSPYSYVVNKTLLLDLPIRHLHNMEPAQAPATTWPSIATTVVSISTAAGGFLLANAVNIDWSKAVKSDKVLRSLL